MALLPVHSKNYSQIKKNSFKHACWKAAVRIGPHPLATEAYEKLQVVDEACAVATEASTEDKSEFRTLWSAVCSRAVRSFRMHRRVPSKKCVELTRG